MSTYQIRIPFTPKAKTAIRVGKMGIYNPSRPGMLKVQKYVQRQMEMDLQPIFKGPLLVIMHLRIPCPLTLSKKRKEQQDYHPHTKKPDGDNLEKFLNDSLNGILWEDDKQLAWVLRTKTLTQKCVGETILTICEMPDAFPDYDCILNFIKDFIKLDGTIL